MTKTNRGLGRLHIPDSRDERFLLRNVLPKAEPRLTHRYWWPSGWWGDQGYTPQCVAYAWMHWLEDGPITHAPRGIGEGPVLDPRLVYREAQRVDQWPGESYDGTSVRAGAKVLQQRGLIGSYRWGWTLADLIDSVLQLGPTVVGTWWYSEMWNTDAEGFLHVSGSRVGGHAYLVNGVNVRRGVLRLKNSWGRGWGENGAAWIGFEDMERLIHEHGEVCIADENQPREEEMAKKIPNNEKAGEMTYEIQRQPNARIERDRAIREGKEKVELPEAEVTTVEIDTPEEGGK